MIFPFKITNTNPNTNTSIEIQIKISKRNQNPKSSNDNNPRNREIKTHKIHKLIQNTHTHTQTNKNKVRKPKKPKILKNPFEKQENHDKHISSFTKKTLKQSKNLIQIVVVTDKVDISATE